jgi:hypothetical protein
VSATTSHQKIRTATCGVKWVLSQFFFEAI